MRSWPVARSRCRSGIRTSSERYLPTGAGTAANLRRCTEHCYHVGRGQPPGHFCGVATVVSKLFNLVQPDLACFGEKDYQQWVLIRKMVADMGYDIDIVGVPTVRAKDGLALSSRNSYLTANERKITPQLHMIMNALAQQLVNGERHIDEMLEQTTEQLRAAGFTPDALFLSAIPIAYSH